ncbi:rhomboid family intramembrane serine protease [Neptuniibacter sp. CAU 1671]|uniref:rhomboid family intramembrane serine protease n=1 Tax=Neptuniibacter sp. CAU 1671 TaxID=3032593 RepID=UPI0023DB45B8|nr:rhomboid family intramembrane serine protease [Neptuniibacter sp. CAU 1671]MDF2182755.1 rhomboid family intramembrane serine protease [Neptuniibacter sp. CAU 1671]
MIKILELPLQDDLTEFTRFLWQQEVPHRVIEEGDTQQLWLANPADAEQVLGLFKLWRQGQSLDQFKLVRQRQQRPSLGRMLTYCWVCALLMGASLLITLGINFGQNKALLFELTLSPVTQQGGYLLTNGLSETFSSFQLWRLFTPVFLHFSPPHLLFNLLWIWVVGSRIEFTQGHQPLLALALFSGVASNLAQYWHTGPMFGGMSGVVFALFAYAWLWDRLNPSRPLGIPPAMMGFMVLWLALGYTGMLAALGFGNIANTAHLAGLVAGLVFVPFGRWLARKDESK